jgi:hypothetical protein
MGSAGGPCRANSQPGGSEGAASILHGGIMGMGRGLADPNLHRIAVRNLRRSRSIGAGPARTGQNHCGNGAKVCGDHLRIALRV